MFFEYDQDVLDYLASRDEKLKWAIEQIGRINRPVDDDLFSGVVNSIVGQQISTKAQTTIWNRIVDELGEVTPASVEEIELEVLQAQGISFRKAHYIKKFAHSVTTGAIDLDALEHLDDHEIIIELTKIDGIGKWTAEMLLLFSLQRQNVVSQGDLAILRGMRMLYHHRKITDKLFKKYQRRYSPYGSIASLYLWAIAGGAIEGMKDYAPKTK